MLRSHGNVQKDLSLEVSFFSDATDAAHVALPLSATESAPSECQSDDSWTHIQQGKLSNEEYKERLQREMRRINALDLSVPGDVQAVQE